MTLLICQWKFSSTHCSFWNEKQQLKYKYQKQKLNNKKNETKQNSREQHEIIVYNVYDIETIYQQ